MIKNNMRPIHPGEILKEEYLIPIGMSVNALATALRVPSTRIHAIIKKERAVTADTALRLARYFGGDAQSWVNMQSSYDLKIAEQEKGEIIVPSLSFVSTAHCVKYSGHKVIFSDIDPLTGCIDPIDIEKKIIKILEEKVRPAVARDGGDIKFKEFKDGVVTVNLQGSCSGCPSSTMTLKQGVQNLLCHYIPEIKEVIAI